MVTDAASMESETNGDQSLGLEEGENDALQEDELADEVLQEGDEHVDKDHGHHGGGFAVREQLQDEVVGSLQAAHKAGEELDAREASEVDRVHSRRAAVNEILTDAADEEEAESVAGTYGSSVADEYPEAAEENGNASDEGVTVASVFVEDEIGMATYVESVLSGLEEDTGEVDLSDGSGPMKTVDASEMCVLSRARQENASIVGRLRQKKNVSRKGRISRTPTGLCEYYEHRRRGYLDDYVANLTLNNPRVLDKNSRPIRASQAKVPRNRREILRSKWILMAEMEEMAALKANGVIEEIPEDEVPEDAKPANTMWMYALKSDQYGYVVSFKARIVALGNYQRPAELGLELYGRDINTAYLNAWLDIRQ
ncbi:hypothetical protein PF002_g27450 [Phytophthora fragariae]|uniref:Reverse transcriptase Ty1/copia-type domain-containing protein n=1 Tax=Phytophthora fragariae TaxID=53985 RepID=A0A6A3Q858_9STRA|nr:hypothetical protein PF007_g26707 [Phytophthora fragariae]KAE9180829.1 hypothetical protein PF002_g27450 [Phytophthora fragariae]